MASEIRSEHGALFIGPDRVRLLESLENRLSVPPIVIYPPARPTRWTVTIIRLLMHSYMPVFRGSSATLSSGAPTESARNSEMGIEPRLTSGDESRRRHAKKKEERDSHKPLIHTENYSAGA